VIEHRGPIGAEPVLLPDRWPSAWPTLYPVVRDRAVFVAAVALLTGVGLAFAGDPSAQWWAIALPVLLLIGPLWRVARTPARMDRAVRTGRVRVTPGRLVLGGTRSGLVLSTGDGPVAVPAGPVARTLSVQVGVRAVLVGRRRPRAGGALVDEDGTVAYLRRVSLASAAG
jgi:hypothetical protein